MTEDSSLREHLVIGSGPAGVSAADVLLSTGHRVRMLDAGGQADPAVRAAAAWLGAREPSEWTPAARDAIRGPLRYSGEGMPLKLAFGSDHMYRDVDRWQPVRSRGVDAYRGLATGGLSTLWGAALAEFSGEDLDGWPIGAGDLAPFYREARAMTGVAVSGGRECGGADGESPLALGPQARLLMERSRPHAAALAASGLRIGPAHLAVQAAATCRYCAMCLYGCPYGLIYSAERTLQERLLASPRFRYESGVIVRRVTHDGTGVVVDAEDREGGPARTFRGERAYLAAGAIATTAILLASLDAAGTAVRLRQSDHLLVPLWLARNPGSLDVPAHTLSQLFLQMEDRHVASHRLHLQLYTYNDHYDRIVADWLGPFHRVAAPAVRPLMRRLVLLKGYLHSDDSTAIRAVLLKRGDATLSLDADAVRTPQRIARRLVRRLRADRHRLGVTPLPLAARVGPPGSSVHVGGSFPMRRDPGPREADALGRVPGLRGVHVVDAAVFPSLPAAPPTLTIMANARRIAAGAARLTGEA